jgi:hypothetical protein
MIPAFDHNHVLPPTLDSMVDGTMSSPYLCQTDELVERFGTSAPRQQILSDYLAYRQLLVELGLVAGFQWIGGSFTENVEVSRNRAPKDLDVVTVFWGIDNPAIFRDIINQLSTKTYKLDAFFVDMSSDSEGVADDLAYWINLFSHTRSKVWKGLLKIPLNTPKLDAIARDTLTSYSAYEPD